MSSAPQSTEDVLNPALRAYAELHGLGRACALFPDAIAAAFARGRQPIGRLPDHIAATTEPALGFVPMQGGDNQ